MPDFYVTFGSQFPRERHPTWGPAHHDGWVRLVGPEDPDTAASWCWQMFGSGWSNLYPHEPDDGFFPLGEIGRIYTGDDGTLRIQDAREYRFLQGARDYLGMAAIRLADATLAIRSGAGDWELTTGDPRWEEFCAAIGAWHDIRHPRPEPPEDVIAAVLALNPGATRDEALAIIERDLRDLTALHTGRGGPV